MNEAAITSSAALLVVAGIVVLVVTVLGWQAWATTRKRREDVAERQARELAIIEESVRQTAFGQLCSVLLVLSVLASLASYAEARTVFQQIAVAVSLIAGVVVFSIGAALGRRRSYTIYRSKNREPY